MKLPEIERQLQQQGMVLFTSQEFRRATGTTPASAKQLLVRYVQKGFVEKLKDNRGLYCLSGRRPHPWLLANRLWRPSYVSLETALSHYGCLPEAVYGVTSVTTRTTRSFESMGLSFVYQSMKPSAYSGYKSATLEGQTVWLAEREKAVADYLYFVHLRKKDLSETSVACCPS